MRKRSLVENTMYRYKTIIGRSMRSRSFAGQQLEAQLACNILNIMTRLSRPDSYKIVQPSALGRGVLFANPGHVPTPLMVVVPGADRVWHLASLSGKFAPHPEHPFRAAADPRHAPCEET